MSNSLAVFKGYTHSSMRLYTGTPALAAPHQNMPQTETQVELVSPQPSADEIVTGTMELYRNTETAMTLELAAQSSAGAVTEMQGWTDQQATDVWQPFAPHIDVPLDTTFYVQFRNAAGRGRFRASGRAGSDGCRARRQAG